MKKHVNLLLLLLCCMHCCQAQLFKPNPSNAAFADSISIIVRDFQTNYANITGVQLIPQGEMDVYRATVTIPGSLHSAIYRFHSVIDTTASYQAIFYEGENFEDAVKVYKNIYRQLTKSKIKWADKRSVSFIGEMETPDENLRFMVTQLKLNIDDLAYERFYGEIELSGTYDGWEVHLNLHSKKDDSEK